MVYKIIEILKNLNVKRYKLIGDQGIKFSKPATIWDGKKGSISFIARERDKDALKLIRKSKSSVILLSKDIRPRIEKIKGKALVLVNNPKEIYIKILKVCFPVESLRSGVDSSAVIHPNASIHPTVHVGHGCIIGKCKIGANSIIHANVMINDGVSIGKNVLIYPSCLIGYEGFGHIANEKGILENFPNYGGVVIEDNVEIFPFTNVDRGTIDDTIIRAGTKIDHFCHVGHNVVIGRNCIITAFTVIAGSAKVGDGAWIGIHSAIRDGISIGKKAMIGMGAVVTKDVPDNAIVVGNPAKPLKKKPKYN